MKFIDLSSRRFGRLLVLNRAPNKGRMTMFACRCDCGNEITTWRASLLNGDTQSCGCLRLLTALVHITHGDTCGRVRTREHMTWSKMLQRCANENDPSYLRYGARGISVCERWMEYANFLEDMGRAPADFTLDRIDNDGNYEPGNCQWASRTEQANNRRSNRLITHQGITQTLAEWARERGIKQSTLGMRLNAYGWPIAKALGEQIG